ncbi:glycosyltransferase family 4 protein [Pontixanthobacter gangjinensis]|uniref:Glycosyltransferase family 4 protein n=1 Tax=Christiangramia aestuarii TaxID=1028746 RepID=A0A7K1LM95_9FLAO|nr:glycosyltransferase family 4 protein [Christiangramia aestuarii]MUP41771.1 glycosyltransferase family 4 protein [Christiangramia aestuarii]
MHIAFLTPEYPHEKTNASGGLGTSIRNLAEGLVKKEVKVSVVVYNQEVDDEFKDNGIDFYFLKFRKYKIGGWYFYRKYIQNQLNSLIKRKGIHLIEATDWTGITAFMNLSCPLVIRLNGTDAYFCNIEGRPQKFKNRFFEKNALVNAHALASVSKFTANRTNEIFGIDKEFQIIPNSIELAKFSPSDIETDSHCILYFGTIIRKKGVLDLAHIFNKVVERKPEVKLLMIGRDVIDVFENRSTLQLFKDSLSDLAKKNFIYKGAIDYDEVKLEIEKSTVVALPSYAEALPMTWIEAMALQKALVTSDIGWAGEVMVNGVTGYTVYPKKHQEYADKLLKLLSEPQLRIEMGSNARKRVEKKFSSEIVSRQNIAFYKEIIKTVNS